MNLQLWSEYINGARAAVVKMVDEYVKANRPPRDKPYIEAEMRYIMESKDNMWRWLSGKGDFRYRGHKRDKRGKLVYCEAYLTRQEEGGAK